MNKYERTFQGFLMFHQYRRTWAFPAEVERLLIDETVALGWSTLHLYGGLARFGVRLDVDPVTRPHVMGNALYPPFACKSFDAVILDPPYDDLRSGVALQILAPAVCLARRKIFWFHTHWSGNALGIRLLRWWACSPCSMGAPTRILAEYAVTRHPKFCIAMPRQGRQSLAKAARLYDWSRLIPEPRAHAPAPIQARLL
jgi:hypothetical protein